MITHYTALALATSESASSGGPYPHGPQPIATSSALFQEVTSTTTAVAPTSASPDSSAPSAHHAYIPYAVVIFVIVLALIVFGIAHLRGQGTGTTPPPAI